MTQAKIEAVKGVVVTSMGLGGAAMSLQEKLQISLLVVSIIAVSLGGLYTILQIWRNIRGGYRQDRRRGD